MSGLFNFVKEMTAGSPQLFAFPNNGVVFDRLPADKYKELLSAISSSTGDKMNSRLVGHLTHEFELPEARPVLEDVVLSLAHVHAGYFNHLKNYSILTEDADMVLGPLWINHQQRHEFNPPHGHEGVYSFVIWIQIPYDLEKEKNVFPDAKHRMTSMFGFVTTDILGRSHVNPIPVDKSYEGVICLFPSSLLHYVNPFFTARNDRISVSGNILLKAR